MASIISAGTTSGTSLNLSGDTSGVLQLATNGSTTAITVDTSQNVGIGTASPVFGSGSGVELYRAGIATYRLSSSGAGVEFRNNSGTGELEVRGAFPLVFGTNATERMRIDSTGTVGIGITPQTWDTTYSGRLQIGQVGAFASFQNLNVAMAKNGYFNGNWKYTVNGTAALNQIEDNTFIWYQASSGTAGNSISWSERMRIDSSGRVTTPAQPAFRAGRLSSVSVADQGVVVFDSATTNIGSNYNTSNGRFTAPVAGMYQFNMQVLFESLSNGNQCEMQFRVNGSDNMAFGPRVKYQADYTGWSGYVSMIGTTSVYLNANDYVQVFNISGGTRSVYGSNPAVWSVFSGFLIG